MANERELIKVKPSWHIDRSIFAPRKAESDAKAYLDNKLVKSKRLATDWARACSKTKFKKLIMSADDDATDDNGLKAGDSFYATRQTFFDFLSLSFSRSVSLPSLSSAAVDARNAHVPRLHLERKNKKNKKKNKNKKNKRAYVPASRKS